MPWLCPDNARTMPWQCFGNAHWEALLQSVSDYIFSKHFRWTPRGVRGVKRSEILWEIQKYSVPGRPSSQNWIKSITICHFLRNFDEFLNGFWFYSILAGWSTWQWVFLNFLQNLWSFDTYDTPGCASAVIWTVCHAAARSVISNCTAVVVYDVRF